MRRDIHPDVKTRLLAAIAAGDLAPAEVARLLQVPRVKVWRWLKEAKIDPEACRAAYIVSAYNRWLALPTPSKKKLRAQAKRALDAWQSHQRDKA